MRPQKHIVSFSVSICANAQWLIISQSLTFVNCLPVVYVPGFPDFRKQGYCYEKQSNSGILQWIQYSRQYHPFSAAPDVK